MESDPAQSRRAMISRQPRCWTTSGRTWPPCRRCWSRSATSIPPRPRRRPPTSWTFGSWTGSRAARRRG